MSFTRSVSNDDWDLFNDGLILFLLYRNTEIFHSATVIAKTSVKVGNAWN